MTQTKSTIIWEVEPKNYNNSSSFFETKKAALEFQKEYEPKSKIYKNAMGYEMTTKQLVCSILNGAGHVWNREEK